MVTGQRIHSNERCSRHQKDITVVLAGSSRIESEARRAPQAEVINIHVALYSLLRI
jgi:hypothetical protein